MNKAVVITAPSGAGKTTLVNMLLENRNDVMFSISACTRKKRDKEIDKKDYYFLSIEDFKKKISNNEFIEWEEVYKDMYYGTLKSELKRIWNAKKAAVFDIDVKGALSIKKELKKDVITIFIAPPDPIVLKNRLEKRGTEDKESFEKRYKKSYKELSYQDLMDVSIVNDNIVLCYKQLNEIIDNFIYRSSL